MKLLLCSCFVKPYSLILFTYFLFYGLLYMCVCNVFLFIYISKQICLIFNKRFLFVPAWWISHQGMKIVFDHMDNFEKSAYPIDRTWELIKEHFSVETRLDLLDHCYAKFNKSTFAGLCQKMATAANSGDSLCQQIFTRAGSLLARSVIALLPNVKPDLVKTGDLSVVCVGSVWKSWDLMTSGFLKEINKVEIPYNISLKKLTVDMAVGAVYLAADDNKKYDIKRDYSKNCEVFHCFSKNKAVNGNGVS